IFKRLETKDPDALERTIYQIGRCRVRFAAPRILELLKSENHSIRSSDVCTLSELNPRALVPDLVRLLRHERGEVRNSAARALSGLDAVETFPDLLPL